VLCLWASLNTLEFLLAYFSTYNMEFHITTVAPEEVLSCQGDSTLASGWIRKSNFDADTQPIQLEILQALATLCLENDVGQFAPPQP